MQEFWTLGPVGGQSLPWHRADTGSVNFMKVEVWVGCASTLVDLAYDIPSKLQTR
jgi:hypothetical protein